MKKILYIEMTGLSEGGYSPMQKVEWEEDSPNNTKAWTAMYDDETGELIWEEI